MDYTTIRNCLNDTDFSQKVGVAVYDVAWTLYQKGPQETGERGSYNLAESIVRLNSQGEQSWVFRTVMSSDGDPTKLSDESLKSVVQDKVWPLTVKLEGWS